MRWKLTFLFISIVLVCYWWIHLSIKKSPDGREGEFKGILRVSKHLHKKKGTIGSEQVNSDLKHVETMRKDPSRIAAKKVYAKNMGDTLDSAQRAGSEISSSESIVDEFLEFNEIERYRWVGSALLDERNIPLSIEFLRSRPGAISIFLLSLVETNHYLEKEIYYFSDNNGKKRRTKTFVLGNGAWLQKVNKNSKGGFLTDGCPLNGNFDKGKIEFVIDFNYKMSLMIKCADNQRKVWQDILSMKLIPKLK